MPCLMGGLPARRENFEVGILRQAYVVPGTYVQRTGIEYCLVRGIHHAGCASPREFPRVGTYVDTGKLKVSLPRQCYGSISHIKPASAAVAPTDNALP